MLQDKNVHAGELVQGGAVLQVPWDAPGQVNSVFKLIFICKFGLDSGMHLARYIEWKNAISDEREIPRLGSARH